MEAKSSEYRPRIGKIIWLSGNFLKKQNKGRKRPKKEEMIKNKLSYLGWPSEQRHTNTFKEVYEC